MAVQQQPIYIKPPGGVVTVTAGNGLTYNTTTRIAALTVATSTDAGAMTASDKAKLDSVTPANIPTSDQKAALAGTGGTPPSTSNPYAERSYVDAAINAVSGEYGAPVQTIAALRAVAYGSTPDKQLRLVEDAGALYRYDSAGTGADDGVGTILPTGNAGNGRWFKVQAATQDHEALTGLAGGGSSDHQHLTTTQVGQLPTANEKAALAGTSGTATSGTNKLVDNADSRLSNARTPSAHASSHVGGGSDAIATAVAAGAAGLMSGADKTKLDGIASGATVAPALSSTTPSMDGSAAVGTGTTTARADHIHPSDTSRAPVAGVPGAWTVGGKVKVSGLVYVGGPLAAFESTPGLYGYYSDGGVLAAYADGSGTLSTVLIHGSGINFRIGSTNMLSIGGNVVYPAGDNVTTIGHPSYRFSALHAVTMKANYWTAPSGGLQITESSGASDGSTGTYFLSTATKTNGNLASWNNNYTEKAAIAYNGAAAFQGPVSGNGAYNNTSDRREKENIRYAFPYGLETVLQLRPAQFDRVDGEKDELGFIAQDVDRVIPEAVGTMVLHRKKKRRSKRTRLTLKEASLIPILVRAVQELAAKVERLEGGPRPRVKRRRATSTPHSLPTDPAGTSQPRPRKPAKSR